MKICCLGLTGFSHTEKWVRYLADKGHEIHLISAEPFEGDKVGNAELYLLRRVRPRIPIISFLIDTLFHIVQTRKLVRKINPDILHVHYVFVYGFLAALSGFHPLVLSVWGSDVFVHPHRSPIHHYIVRFALERADLVTTTSRYANEYVHQEFNVSPNKIKRVAWGIDRDVFQKGYLSEVRALRKKLNISDDTFTVFSPREMGAHYGIEFIIKSIPYVIEKYPSICFILLRGLPITSPYENKLQTIAESLGVKEYTRFVSLHLDHEEMAIYYNMCDVLISIPRSDQFASCIIEGMACGAIPIVGNLEVYREYLSDGKNAFFVDRENPMDIAEKVIHCIEHPELKERFYRLNRKIVEKNLEWNKNAPHMEELYLSLLEGRHLE